jgi:hypothetical protein
MHRQNAPLTLGKGCPFTGGQFGGVSVAITAIKTCSGQQAPIKLGFY